MALALITMEHTKDKHKVNGQRQPIKTTEALIAQSQIEVFHLSPEDPHQRLLAYNGNRFINMLLHIEVHHSRTLNIKGAREELTLKGNCNQRFHEHTIVIALESDLEAILECYDDTGYATIRILEVY
ncbi:hypothetical protein [Fodinibius saliphilus]|uniref:hypothetical protein n=1 Tax=Fodinibius saliphilus TaxID=1920650 RepID=UPI00110921DB|nr:hypothetical protein [Fodinibius saliphilus]